jgi:hypothetical protein
MIGLFLGNVKRKKEKETKWPPNKSKGRQDTKVLILMKGNILLSE